MIENTGTRLNYIIVIQDRNFGHGAGSRSRGSGLWVSYPTGAIRAPVNELLEILSSKRLLTLINCIVTPVDRSHVIEVFRRPPDNPASMEIILLTRMSVCQN